MNRFPAWYLTGTPALELVGAIVGGMLYVGSRARDESQATRVA